MENELNPERKIEKEPITYEKVLDALKALRLAWKINLNETLDPDTSEHSDPDVESAFELIREWRDQVGFSGPRDINDVEKATNTVKDATLFVDAGYIEKQHIRNALEELTGDYSYEIRRRRGNDDEVTLILKNAIKTLQTKFEQTYPNEKVSKKIESAIKKILIKARSGNREEIIDSVRLIATTTSVGNYNFAEYYKTVEGSKKLEYIKKLESIIIRIYKNTLAGKDTEDDLELLDSIVEVD
jgi:hypothetical protein